MRFFKLFILALLATLVKGFWFGSEDPVSSPSPSLQKEEDLVIKVLGPRPELPGNTCYELYNEKPDVYTTQGRYGRRFIHGLFPTPPRHPRVGLSFEDLSHAHLIITYSQCRCFNLTTQEGWDYLLSCNRLFDDLDVLVKRFVKVKEDRVLWDEKAKSFKSEL